MNEYTVYFGGSAVGRTKGVSPATSKAFETAEAAHIWARAQQRRTGGSYECRDANFDHVFTVED